jgi:iron complex outermembrane recepter protein
MAKFQFNSVRQCAHGGSRFALATAMLAASMMPAYAQDSVADGASVTSDEGNDIIVSGFRRSVESAIAVKRETEFFADFITSDDIAGLPDVSIAESIARLPGVSAQRTGGQASAINIRGLSQDLVSATLNGREQVATSGNRVIEFDQYPSELISTAAVYKSPIASIIEGGVAGKVELRTARPLDNSEKFSGQVNIRALYNDRASDNPDVSSFGYRGSISFQAKLADDTLGIAVGYSRLYQPNVATRFVNFDFAAPGNNGSPTRDIDGNGTPDRYTFGFEGIQFGGRETRDGVIAVIQWEPADTLRVLVDGYYSKFKSDVNRRGLRVFNTQSGDNALANPTVVNNAIVGGTYTNQIGSSGFGFGLGTELVNQDESREDELYTIAGNVAYDVSDRITASVDVSYSRATSFFNNSGINIRPYVNSGAGLVRADSVPGVISASYVLDGLNMPTINSISTDFTNAANFQFDGLFIVPQADTDKLFAVAGDVTVEFDSPIFKSLQVGGRYSTRNGTRRITSFRTFGPDGGPLALPADLLRTGGFSGSYGATGLPDFIVADIDGLLDLGVGQDRVADQAFGFTRDQSFDISEDTYAGYAQLNIETVAGALPLTGNIGLRVVRTSQGSTPLGTAGAGIFRGRDFTDFLPSANLNLALTDEDRLRLSYSRQISRPRFFELRGSIDVSVASDGGPPSGSGGNPDLLPFRANQFDFAYEHYFGRTGIFSAGIFYKALSSYIIGGTIDQFDFAAEGLSFAPPPAPQPGGPIGRFNTPVNGNGGYVWGVEFNYTQTFSNLPAPFDGLGVVLNYSYSESDLNFVSSRSGQPLPLSLPGLSKHVANPTIFYEKNGFGIRGSVRYRSSFVAPQIGLDEQIVTNGAETVADAQISYEFQKDSALHGLKIVGQVNNLTDAPTRSFFGQRAQTGTIQSFGRTFYLGATYKF